MNSSSSNREPVEKLAEEFAARFRNGERPALTEYTDKYPELADEIRELFPALVMMEQFGTVEGDKTGPFAERSSAATPKQLGEYRILREVGHGGMGVVYEAVQESLGRHVALKVLPHQTLSNPQHLERFRREARAAGRLHHTNIVPVFGVGECDGVHFYAMQFIQGQGLDLVMSDMHRLRNGPKTMQAASEQSIAGSLVTGRFAVASESATAESSHSSWVTRSGFSTDSEHALHRSVARVGLQVAEALAYAHKQGVLHRDIKPSNLLLDMQGNVWITDFGLAKEASPGRESGELTTVGDIVGTIRYMAPERFDGRSLPQSDVYGLGLTLYELLTLKPAFAEPNRGRLIEKVLNEPPIAPRKLDRSIPRDLETVVLKSIAKDPKERYASAEAMSEDLRRFLADRPILGRRSPWTERTWRWCRRNPAMASVLGLVALLLVAGTLASSIAAVLFRQARDDADDARKGAEKASKDERWERYRSNIAVASGALQLQNSGTARRALEDAPEEHRNWEWQYLHSQLDGASLVLPVPGGKIRSLVLSPSGRQVAVCCTDHNEVYLYDVATGRLEAVLRGHTAAVTSVVYRPDVRQVATSGNDHTIRLWDPATGQQTALLKAEAAPPKLEVAPLLAYNSDGSRIATYGLYAADDGGNTSQLWDASTGKEIAVLAKWQANIRPLAFSPDGKRVAVGSAEFVYLFDAVTGRRVAVLGPHAKRVLRLAYSSDGKRIVSATDEGSSALHLWDGETGKEVAVLHGHTSRVFSVAFSPDGSRLVTGSDYPDQTARLWDAATGRSLAVLAGHKNEILTVAFSPDGKRVATASSDQTARLWDERTGQLLAVLGGHTDRVRYVLISPNGTRVVTASDDATLRLWDAQTGELIGVLRGHGDVFPPNSPPVFTPDGSRLVSGSRDGTVRIWDLSLVERNGILRGHESYVYDIAFSPNGEQVASAAWDGTARLWDATTGRQTGLLKHETGIITSVAYSRDGRRLASLERGRGVMLWDLASQKAARDWRIPESGHDPRASLNPAGTLLTAPSAEGPVRLWDVDTGREVARLEGHDKHSIDVAFHPDGSLLATTGMDGTVRLWDIATHAAVAVLRGHTDAVWRVAFSTDGKLLASASSDKTIRLWDAQTHQQLAVIPQGSIVYSVAFSPDGTRLAAGCRDNTIRLIDVASRQQVAELRGHSDYVHAVAWSPDGTRLVSGSGDFTVRVWDSLSVQERARQTPKPAPAPVHVPPAAYISPKGYVCYRAASPPRPSGGEGRGEGVITIDGKLDEDAWKSAPWTDDFVDIEGDIRPKPRFRTRAKMLWDDHYFYISAELEEPHVQGTFTKRDSYIFHEDNDFEVFIDPDGDNHNYLELEMNALNTVWDLRLARPYKDGGKAQDGWDITGLKTAVHVNGTINNPRDNDVGWTIEMAIPWEALQTLGGKLPRDGDHWRVNFSRVEWRYDIVDGKYVRVKNNKEDNWVWSPQGAINMHMPERWGYVQFSKVEAHRSPSVGMAAFHPDPTGPARHVLHRIYYAQRAFLERHQRFALRLEELPAMDLGHGSLIGPPLMEADANHFRCTVQVRIREGVAQRVRIHDDARVELLVEAGGKPAPANVKGGLEKP